MINKNYFCYFVQSCLLSNCHKTANFVNEQHPFANYQQTVYYYEQFATIVF